MFHQEKDKLFLLIVSVLLVSSPILTISPLKSVRMDSNGGSETTSSTPELPGSVSGTSSSTLPSSPDLTEDLSKLLGDQDLAMRPTVDAEAKALIDIVITCDHDQAVALLLDSNGCLKKAVEKYYALQESPYLTQEAERSCRYPGGIIPSITINLKGGREAEKGVKNAIGTKSYPERATDNTLLDEESDKPRRLHRLKPTTSLEECEEVLVLLDGNLEMAFQSLEQRGHRLTDFGAFGCNDIDMDRRLARKEFPDTTYETSQHTVNLAKSGEKQRSSSMVRVHQTLQKVPTGHSKVTLG